MVTSSNILSTCVRCGNWIGERSNIVHLFRPTPTQKSRGEKEKSLEMKQLQKAAHHPLLLYSLLWSSCLSYCLPAAATLLSSFSEEERYVLVLFCRIGTIQNHSYELPLPSPLDIFKDDPQQKNVTKGERICHYQIDDLMLWLPI